MYRSVVIDSLPESVARYRSGWAIVAIDVVRATTTAVTAAVSGRRCVPVPSLTAAYDAKRRLPNALLAGEIGGLRPDGFDLQNSPAEFARRKDIERPAILLSSSGTRLICDAAECDTELPACFRNARATAEYCVQNFQKVAVIGAGSRDEFREEDQLCCAWIAQHLLNCGFLANEATWRVVERWGNQLPGACVASNSFRYLERTGQLDDLDFVLSHVNDVSSVFTMKAGEVVGIASRQDESFFRAQAGTARRPGAAANPYCDPRGYQSPVAR